jgi:hypothetical protein
VKDHPVQIMLCEGRFLRPRMPLEAESSLD